VNKVRLLFVQECYMLRVTYILVLSIDRRVSQFEKHTSVCYTYCNTLCNGLFGPFGPEDRSTTVSAYQSTQRNITEDLI
jgi:hypothetical protein